MLLRLLPMPMDHRPAGRGVDRERDARAAVAARRAAQVLEQVERLDQRPDVIGHPAAHQHLGADLLAMADHVIDRRVAGHHRTRAPGLDPVGRAAERLRRFDRHLARDRAGAAQIELAPRQIDQAFAARRGDQRPLLPVVDHHAEGLAMLGGLDQHRCAGRGLGQSAQDERGEQHPTQRHGRASSVGSPEP
jgi:hypothetical protein